MNLSDDMKEMTNCVRQAIRSSSLERKSPKEAGSQVTNAGSLASITLVKHFFYGRIVLIGEAKNCATILNHSFN